MILNPRTLIPSFVIIGLFVVSNVSAEVIYVNNQAGSDKFDGSSANLTDQFGGPVRTFRKAVRMTHRGDTISIANTGTPYHQSLELTGMRNSGYNQYPFIIEGNGATLSGACPVPPFAWRYRKNGLWQFRPLRKGHYLLLRDGKPVEEQPVTSTSLLMHPSAGMWSASQGSIFYQATQSEVRPSRDYSFAFKTTGISLYAVRHVRIRNLTLKHYRLDGIGAHDLSKDVILENVTCIENGRAGIAVAGTCDVRIESCTVLDNRRNSIRISELGGADVENSDIEPEPVIVN
jgi:hypothetical protein